MVLLKLFGNKNITCMMTDISYYYSLTIFRMFKLAKKMKKKQYKTIKNIYEDLTRDLTLRFQSNND